MRLKDFVWGVDTAAAMTDQTNTLFAVSGRDGRVISATVNWGPDTMETDCTGDGIYYRPLIPYRNRPVRITWRTLSDSTGAPVPCFNWADLQEIDYCETCRHDEVIRNMGAAHETPFLCVPGVEPAPDVKAAARRARDLLMSLLSPAQRDMFRKEQAIIVVAASGTCYRLRSGNVNNIDQLDANGTPSQRLCVHPVGVPLDDSLATQLLGLMYDEQGIRLKANITDVKTGRLIQSAAA
jgi:hypothetical protein